MLSMSIVWRPTDPEKAQLWHFMRHLEKVHACRFPDYATLHRWSNQYPALFWSELTIFLNITWNTPPQQILKPGNHMLDAQWFVGATFNFAEKLLARNDDHPALISTDEHNRQHIFTYQTLRQNVLQCAQAIKKIGIQPGDCIVGVLPNTAFTVMAMLATTAVGAIWASCSPDFGQQALEDRLGQIAPKVLFICDGYTYHGKSFHVLAKMQALSQALPSIKKIILCPFLNSQTIPIANSVLWDEFIQEPPLKTFTAFPFNHPVYILFTSGTTGRPKCIVHGAGGTLIQHLKELALHTDMTSADNLLFYTTCGWMMWNWMVSALALGSTLTLFDGSPTYPTNTHLFGIIDKLKVTILGCGAKFIATLDKSNARPQEQYACHHLKTILSTGSPLLPHCFDYVYQHIKSNVQLSSISGGTDILSCFALGNPILPVIRGEIQCIGLGMAVEIYNTQGQPLQNRQGELVCTQPFPSMPIAFWQDSDQSRYKQTYFARFPNVWAHGDLAEITPQGGLIIYGRSDSILNPGGVRMGTAEIYRQIESIPDIIEAVVIGQNWEDDVRIVLFVKLADGIILTEAFAERIKQHIRTHASPRHVPAKILQVKDIPKTLSGKVVETAVREIVHHRPIQNIDSLANPEALEEFKNRSELSQ